MKMGFDCVSPTVFREHRYFLPTGDNRRSLLVACPIKNFHQVLASFEIGMAVLDQKPPGGPYTINLFTVRFVKDIVDQIVQSLFREGKVVDPIDESQGLQYGLGVWISRKQERSRSSYFKVFGQNVGTMAARVADETG